MPTNRSTAFRNYIAAARTTFAGAAPKLTLETSGGTALAVFTCADPMAPAPVNGVRTMTLPADVTWLANGTVARASLYAADGTTLIERYTAAVSGAEVTISSVNAVTGTPVSVLSWTHAEPS